MNHTMGVVSIAFDKASYDRKYADEKTTVIRFRLNNLYDADLLAHLATKDNMSGYIKQLIRDDMDRVKNK